MVFIWPYMVLIWFYMVFICFLEVGLNFLDVPFFFDFERFERSTRNSDYHRIFPMSRFFLNFERSNGNSNVRPEIPTTTEFFLHTKSPLGGSCGPGAPKTAKGRPKGRKGAANNPPIWEGFSAMLGLKITKIQSWRLLKTNQLRHWCFIDFEAVRTSFWQGFGDHVGVQDRSKNDVYVKELKI